MADKVDKVGELITVQEFARRYQVDTTTVRWWVKKGYITYVLVGPRHLKRIRANDALHQARAHGDPVNVWGNYGHFDDHNHSKGINQSVKLSVEVGHGKEQERERAGEEEAGAGPVRGGTGGSQAPGARGSVDSSRQAAKVKKG